MELELRGKLALVTGASGDVGAACAALLSTEGVRLRLSGRSPERLDALCRVIRETGGEAVALPGDLVDEAYLDTLVTEDAEPDLLVHAAGHRYAATRLHNESAEDAALTRAVDEESFAQLCRRALPGMMARRFGRIVAVTSVLGQWGGAGLTRYAAAKAAVEGLIRAIAVDYGRYRITANAVAPGFVNTTRFVARAQPENVRRFQAATSLKRLASPEEVAAPVVFLCSARASYVTGATLLVSGGAHLNNLW